MEHFIFIYHLCNIKFKYDKMKGIDHTLAGYATHISTMKIYKTTDISPGQVYRHENHMRVAGQFLHFMIWNNALKQLYNIKQ